MLRGMNLRLRTRPRSKDGHNGESGYRISDLVDLTGVPRETLKYYFRTGLLPRNRRTKREWPVYSAKYVDLVRLVLQFQQQTRLTLPQIADVFRKADYDPKEIEISLLAGTHEKPGAAEIVVGISPAKESPAAAIGLPEDFIGELRAAGLAPRHRKLTVSEERAAALIQSGVRAGLPLGFFAETRASLERIVQSQMQAMMSVNLKPADADELNRQLIETNRLVNRWITWEKDLLIQKRFARVYESSRKNLEELRRAEYVPSEVFIRKHKADMELSDLERRCSSARNRRQLLPALAEASLALGRLDLAKQASGEALAEASGQLMTLIAAARIDEFAGNFASSAALAAQAAGMYPAKPAALAAAATDCLLQASRMFPSGKGNEWLAKAAQYFSQAMALSPSSPRDLFDQRYFLGRAHAVMPGVFGRIAEAIAGLEAALVQLNSGEDLGFPLPSIRQVYRVAILFYLGQLQIQAGDTAAADRTFREVIQMDPASNFGLMAFEKIAH